MTNSPGTISVNSEHQTTERGASGKSLTELANGLPTLKTSGLRADHAAAAQAIIARAKAALTKAAGKNTTTSTAATTVGTIDKGVKAEAEGVQTPPAKLV